MIDIISLLSSDGYIVVNKTLMHKLGIECAVLVGELCAEYNYYKLGNKLEDDGSFYSTRTNIEKNTGFNEYKQRKLIKILSEQGILTVTLKGLPAKNYYKINKEVLQNIFFEFENSENLSPLKNEELSSLKNEELHTEKLNINNNNINNNNNNKTFTNVNVSSEAAEHTKIEESCFNFGTKKENKPKKSLYQKCIDLINDYTTDEKLKNVLIQYLDFRLENSQTTGKPFYSNNFKGLLNTLDKVIKESDNTVTKVDIVQKALNGCYMNFFAVNNINTGSSKIFKENIDEPQRKVDRNNLAKDEDGNYLIY